MKPLDEPMRDCSFRLPESYFTRLDQLVDQARALGLDVKRPDLTRHAVGRFLDACPTIEHFLLALRSPQQSNDVIGDQPTALAQET